MASKTIETKNLQKDKFLQLNDARKDLLKSKGLSDKDIAKDPKVKHNKARIKQITKAEARINFLEDQTQKLKEKKEQRMAEEAAAKLEDMRTERRSKKKTVEPEKASEPKKKGSGAAKGAAKAKGGEQKKKGK